MNSKKLVRSIIPLVLGGLFVSGCAQVMAIKQPRPFVPASLTVGAKRVDIVEELGRPITSEEQTNRLTDAYKYVDGGEKNNGASKTSRVILYTAGDFFTLWLDQIVWIPAEEFGFAGTDHAVTVNYIKYEDGLWHATNIENRVLKGRSSQKDEF
jgi:hypothetical protein